MKRYPALLMVLIALLLCSCTNTEEDNEPPVTLELPTFQVPSEEIEPSETDHPKPTWEIIVTGDSTCFTIISYCADQSLLRVQFRESKEWYLYYDVEPETWYKFKNADSHGTFFNKFIKGSYEYDRDERKD